MPFIHDVGKISIEDEIILWTIPDFLAYPQTVDSGLWSPEFKFLGKRWQVGLWPNGWKQDSSEGWIGIGLMNRTDKAAFKVHLGLKGINGEDIQSQEAEWDGETWFDASTFIPRLEFVSRKDEIAEDGALTIVCEIFIEKDNPESETQTSGETSKNMYHNSESKAQTSGETNKNMYHNSESKAQTSGETNKNMYHNSESKAQTSGKTSKNKEVESRKDDKVKKNKDKALSFSEFVRNIRKSFQNCDDFDVIINVKGFEHRVHRKVLTDRCEYFASMFSDAEDDGVISIEVTDCEPHAFREFLVYLYTGVVDAINKYNMLDTYFVANKYKISDFKEKCLEFIEENLDSSQIFQILQMVVDLDDPELLKLATEMFVENVEEILDTNEWYNFLCDHPAQANDLFIKTVQKLKERNED